MCGAARNLLCQFLHSFNDEGAAVDGVVIGVNYDLTIAERYLSHRPYHEAIKLSGARYCEEAAIALTSQLCENELT